MNTKNERCYYTYTIPIDEQGAPLIIHRSERFDICHAFDKDGRNVVLKIATDAFFAEKDEIEKAYRRARAALDFSQRTDCDGCCKIYDVVLNNDDFYIAMQYIDGIPLSSILNDVDIIENSGDLDVLEQQLEAVCARLNEEGLKPSALCAQNIMLRRDTDGIVLLNYIALSDDEVPKCELPAKDFVDRIRAVKNEERNKFLQEQWQEQLRQRRIKRCLWLVSLSVIAVCIILYILTATTVPHQIAAKWKYDTVESCHSFFRVRLGNQYGVLSPTYQEIVPVAYDNIVIDPRHSTTFVVSKNNRCGVYHTTSRCEGIPLQYDSVIWVKDAFYRVYRDGASLLADASQSRFVYTPSDYLVYKSGKQYGYRDVFGQVLIEPQFDDAKPFLKTDFFAAASKKAKWGMINRNGQFLITPQYEEIRPHAEIAAAKKGGKWGYVSIKNKPLCDFIYTKVADWGREVANAGRVYMNNKSMLLNGDGEYLYRDDDMIISNIDGTYYVTDQFDHILFCSSKVDKIYDYSCGRARVRIDGILIDDYGYIDYYGNVVIPIKYSEASDFENDKAVVAEGNLFRDRKVIDLDGRTIREL